MCGCDRLSARGVVKGPSGSQARGPFGLTDKVSLAVRFGLAQEGRRGSWGRPEARPDIINSGWRRLVPSALALTGVRRLLLCTLVGLSTVGDKIVREATIGPTESREMFIPPNIIIDNAAEEPKSALALFDTGGRDTIEWDI